MLKPYRSNRSRAYYRHHRKRVINRKLGIIKHYYWKVKNDEYGRLVKGKIHCSCWMCSEKTNQLGPKKSEKARIISQIQQLNDYEIK